MTVRRLADEQPASFDFTPENRAWCDAQIAKYPPGRQASAVIPLLWKAQAQHDYWLPKPAIEKVAEILDMPYIRVLEIATFYSMFNLAPVGKHFIQLCGTTPCMLRGSEDVLRACKDAGGLKGVGDTSADGLFTLTEVECLGACVNAPILQIDDDYYEDLDYESAVKLLEAFKRGERPKPGSAIGRQASAPAGEQTVLTGRGEG